MKLIREMNYKPEPPVKETLFDDPVFITVKNNISAFVTKQCRRRSGCRRLGVGPVHISIYLALIVEHLDSARPKQEAA